VEIRDVSPHQLLYPGTHVQAAIEQLLHEFWNLQIRTRLFSVAKEPHYYWHMQDFYVAQKGLDKDGIRWTQLRISEGLCQHLFESALGKPAEDKEFSLDHIRNFEVFLLERFSRKLFHILYPMFLKQADKHAPLPEHDPLVHLVWILDSSEPEQINQIVLTAPQSCLKTEFPDLPQPPVWNLPEERFHHADVEARFRIGSTRVELEEAQNLEEGDVVLLENSHASRWHLLDSITQGTIPVNISIPPRFHAPEHLQQQGYDAMANDAEIKQNIWDTLEVEVTATFEPVKLPLRHLRDMEQGLVVEVGDLMENRIHIEVEGHPVAWGELLVVGDKFGVRILGVDDSPPRGNRSQKSAYASQPTEPHVSQAPEEMHQQEEMPPANDLMDLNLEESDFDDMDDEEDWT
jgi:flagellar motor switch/type III secretory pathway protein FliN